MARLFFSYSHRDEELRDQLEVHLAILKRQGLIETWLKPLMNASDRDVKLSFEGAAELLWTLFMAPLQRARR